MSQNISNDTSHYLQNIDVYEINVKCVFIAWSTIYTPDKLTQTSLYVQNGPCQTVEWVVCPHKRKISIYFVIRISHINWQKIHMWKTVLDTYCITASTRRCASYIYNNSAELKLFSKLTYIVTGIGLHVYFGGERPVVFNISIIMLPSSRIMNTAFDHFVLHRGFEIFACFSQKQKYQIAKFD